MEFTLDIIKIALLTLAFLYGVHRFNREKFRASSHENLKALLLVYDAINDDESLLEIYGIKKEEITSRGLSVQQFVYLLKDFTAGQLYYDTNAEHHNGMFYKGNHRYHLCSQVTTRNAWPLLKSFFGATKYGECIEKTINFAHDNQTNT